MRRKLLLLLFLLMPAKSLQDFEGEEEVEEKEVLADACHLHCRPLMMMMMMKKKKKRRRKFLMMPATCTAGL